MKKVVLCIALSVLSISGFGQNAYQQQLYFLTQKLDAFEAQSLSSRKVDVAFGDSKLELIKDFHRLGEEAFRAGLQQKQSEELGSLINLTTDIACDRLDMLDYYLRYNNDLYKVNLDRSKTIFMSFYLKIKALEE